jgi:hypothetical protein
VKGQVSVSLLTIPQCATLLVISAVDVSRGKPQVKCCSSVHQAFTLKFRILSIKFISSRLSGAELPSGKGCRAEPNWDFECNDFSTS